MCGKVLSVGSKVPDDVAPRVGDVVVVYRWPGCGGQCETCSADNWQLCDNVHGPAADADAATTTPPAADQRTDSSLHSFQVL